MNQAKTEKLAPTILVIVGITGDLATRKLLPAIAQIAAAGALPAQFRIVGVTRRNISVSDVLSSVKTPGTPNAHDTHEFLRQNMELFCMNLEDAAGYAQLHERLAKLRAEFGENGEKSSTTRNATRSNKNSSAQILFYLSVPPQVSGPIVAQLGRAGFGSTSACKLLVEKPFGTDLTSATELIASLHAHFNEQQIYRIDHYLAKEMAQNLVVFRASNSLFKATWNRDFIERIEIIASEKIGIEGRATFYEQTGALRDFVQSHLLQLAALTLMPLPAHNDWQAVPAARLQALQMLEPPTGLQLASNAIRGQYNGYQTEAKNQGSNVETFVSLTLESRDPAWLGVPITLTTGKALNRKTTEICIHYKQQQASEANELVLRVQPNEGIEIALWSKRPGYDRQLEKSVLRFAYNEQQGALPEAYEQVLLDAIRGDRTLFTSGDEVLASWHILEPVLQAWSMSNTDLKQYEPGSSPQQIIES